MKSRICLFIVVLITIAGAVAAPVTPEWRQKISQIIWVAYSPSSGNPQKGIEPTPESVKEDLAVLKRAGFTGLVTYSANGILGNELPSFAEQAGYKGIIIGLWDLSSTQEISAAKSASTNPLVLGLCVGNEGFPKRYDLKELSAAIQRVREETGKPVTTTEEIDDYSDEEVLKLGDWVFPNAHPFFHSRLEPQAAVKWTCDAYKDLKSRTERFVMFKEVGLPTAGDSGGKLSEASQEWYYSELAKAGIPFVYFEAFDLPWKDHLPIESHWGIFLTDRSPKRLGWRLMGKEGPSETLNKLSQPSVTTFDIYSDATSERNHFKPTGFMGDCGDITVNESCDENPHSGATCIKVIYTAKGKGPNKCDYPGPCRWAGVYWQEPADNWGVEVRDKDKGFDLSSYDRLVFWARSDKECKMEFKVGGNSNLYGDSLTYPRAIRVTLNPKWERHEIELKGANLKRLISGFCWVSNWDTNPTGATFYLDDIRFEKKIIPVIFRASYHPNRPKRFHVFKAGKYTWYHNDGIWIFKRPRSALS